MSEHYACPDCDFSIPELEPRMFSFNNPFGACPVCNGLGYKMEFDPELLIPDESLSINQGAIAVLGWQSSSANGSFTNQLLKALAREYGFSLDAPFGSYPQEIKDMLIFGTGSREVMVHYEGQRGKGVYPVTFEGIVRNVERRYRETASELMRQEYESFMTIPLPHWVG